jgi:hypothetical protein
MRRVLLGLLAVLVLTGCGTPVQVTRFHRLPAIPQGQTVILRATDPNKDGSLEFTHYARMLAQQLAVAGYPPPPANEVADIVARFDWKIDNMRTVQYSTPIYGPVGPGYFVRRAGADGRPVSIYVPPPQGIVDVAVDTRTLWDATVTVEMRPNKTDGPVLFEGRAVAPSYNPDIAPLMPVLIKGLFEGFPGNSGQTVTVRPDS